MLLHAKHVVASEELVPAGVSWAQSTTRPENLRSLRRFVGRTPWSAADAHVGLLVKFIKPQKAGPGNPRGRGRPPDIAVSVAVNGHPLFSLLSLCGTPRERSRVQWVRQECVR